MAVKTFDEIIQSMLTFLIRRNQIIDIKPTAINRVLLDTVSNELAVMYNEIQHVQTIATVLNANQMTLDELDNYAANFGVNRKDATFATVEIAFYITRETRTDISIPQGTIVTSAVDPALATSVQFATTETVTLFADRLNSYFNPSSGFFEITARAKCLVPGAAGNVAANTLTRVNSNFGTSSANVLATNRAPADTGEDQEDNTSLAARILVSISGINVGTKDGYKNSALATPGVKDAVVVGAGDPMMVRDFNSLGQHIGGRVDVYVQGEDSLDSRDRLTASLQQKLGQVINLIQGSVFGFSVSDPDLESFPLVSVERVYTIIDNPAFRYEDQIAPVQKNSQDISLTIVAPLNGSTVDGSVDVLVRAFKPNGQIAIVNLIVNREQTNRMLFANNRGLFLFSLSTGQFRDGIIQLEAEAFDELNQRAFTNPILINVRNLEDISVRITQPDAGTTITSQADVVVYAFSNFGLAPRGVEIRFNEGRWVPMNLGSVQTRFSLPIVAANFRSGAVKIEVRATDQRQRTAFAVPRFVIVENGAGETVKSNEVRTLSLRSQASNMGGNLMTRSFAPVVRNDLTAGGNFSIARLNNPSDPKFAVSDGDVHHLPILEDRTLVIDVNKHFFEPDGEWAGTNIGLFFSGNDGKSFPLSIHSGNTLGLSEKDDVVNTINKENNNLTYIGTNGGVLVTNDRAVFYRAPVPTDKPITAFGFMGPIA